MTGSSGSCRTCYFNSPLYISSAEDGSTEAGGEIPDYADCPCCVMDSYEGSTAADENGETCTSSGFRFGLDFGFVFLGGTPR